MPEKAGDELKIGYFHSSDDKEVMTAVREKTKDSAKEGLLRFVTTHKIDVVVVEDEDLVSRRVASNLELIGCKEMLIPYDTVVELVKSHETVVELRKALGIDYCL